MFDVKRLPNRALCDTGFWIRALGDRPNDVRTPDAAGFFKAMVEHGREMLMATPSLAELIRGNPSIAVPSTQSVIVVPFDRKAAEELGRKFAPSVIKQQKLKTGYEKAYIQYDAMIVACATRHKADCIIAFDNNIFEDNESLTIPVRNVRDFMLPIMARIDAATDTSGKGGGK